jgi:hypothetical protein
MGEALICMMIGVAHNLITVSEHPWTSGEQLLDIMLGGVFVGSSSGGKP